VEALQAAEEQSQRPSAAHMLGLLQARLEQIAVDAFALKTEHFELRAPQFVFENTD
jgi:hypothetical protein